MNQDKPILSNLAARPFGISTLPIADLEKWREESDFRWRVEIAARILAGMLSDRELRRQFETGEAVWEAACNYADALIDEARARMAKEGK